jgi:hypothetical protein
VANEVRFVGGSALFVGGSLAMSDDCCCGSTPVPDCAAFHALFSTFTTYTWHSSMSANFGGAGGCDEYLVAGTGISYATFTGGTYYWAKNFTSEGRTSQGGVEITCLSGPLRIETAAYWTADPVAGADAIAVAYRTVLLPCDLSDIFGGPYTETVSTFLGSGCPTSLIGASITFGTE